MSDFDPCLASHPEGEPSADPADFPAPHRLDTFGGPVKACWDFAPTVTRNGGLAYFIHFLEVSNTWKEFVDSCPLTYSSPNAPNKEEILATLVYSFLIGHRRYAHIAALFGVKTFRS